MKLCSIRRIVGITIPSLLFISITIGTTQSAPTLVPGVWTNLTSNLFCHRISLDPSNPDILYLSGGFGQFQGLQKSIDRGATWNRVGNPPATNGDTVDYLDAPFQVEVDPKNPQHLYASEMSPGGPVTWGFWVTSNGGSQWVRPKGFLDALKQNSTVNTDVGHFDVDPSDFNHVLVGFHGYPNCFFETKDGGNSFKIHTLPGPAAGGGNGPCFLYRPNQNIGNAQTWLVSVDGDGWWRTENAGANWTESLPNVGSWVPHGGSTAIYFTKSGVLYEPNSGYPNRSTDLGKTWTTVSSAPYGYYYSIIGDGNSLYLSTDNIDSANGITWFTSPESSGNTWTKYTGGALPREGNITFAFDSINRIMYSANGSAGLWALKLPTTGTQGDMSKGNIVKEINSPNHTSPQKMILSGNVDDKFPGVRFYDIKGRLIHPEVANGNNTIHRLRVLIAVHNYNRTLLK